MIKFSGSMKEKHIEKIRKHLDEKEQNRDEILEISKLIIRECSSAMSNLHQGKSKEVSGKIEEVKEIIQNLRKKAEANPQFLNHGTLVAANREFAELVLTCRIINGEELPGPEEINTFYEGYAQGMAEALGELRRHILNLLRKDEVEKALDIHERMEKVFGSLEQFDYPDSILKGFRHRKDGARKTLKKTRADITRAVREKRLEKSLNKVKEKLDEKNEI